MKNTTLAAACLAVGTATALIVSCVQSPSASPPISTAPTNTPTSVPSSLATTAPTSTPSTPATFTQIDRLARPAINEGLLEDDALHNTWNSVGPAIDLTPAAAPIAAQATLTLKAFGNDDATIAKLFGALLPDVMRIDTTRHSGYAGTAGAPLGNLESTKQIPIGGRMITDDVMDNTLLLIVPDATSGAVPGLRSDNVGYSTPDANGHVHKPVLSTFPYAPAPN